jgi:hypothetical protein
MNESHLTVVLSGPMKGWPGHNFNAFFAAEEYLQTTNDRLVVINPARADMDLGFDPTGPAPSRHFLKQARIRDIAAVENADVIMMLPGWEHSKGAKAELSYALWKGISAVWLYSPGEDPVIKVADINPESLIPKYLTPIMDARSDCQEAPVIAPPIFPENADERKTYPIYSGLFKYFPNALAAVAHVSFLGNKQHLPGQPIRWDRSKSADEENALLRHVLEGDWTKVAWRALAKLQKHLEELESSRQ